jgi:hypothetical protein
LAKFFEKKITSGRTVHGSTADSPKLTLNHTERCAAREIRADGPRGPGGRSVGSWRTVRLVQWAPLTAIDFAFLPLEFKCGQSMRASRTVREVCVFYITVSNGMGEYKYSMPGLAELLLAL